jgi:hypothetical protein
MVTETSAAPSEMAPPLPESTSRRMNATRQIPWGYGRDRLTAIAVDPDELFIYWEILDASIDKARAQLGPAGARASLVLRVYDTSGRIFDGTNAHSFFDQDVQRSDRQWFCPVGRPSSSAHIEMGLRTHDGRFLKVMRSGRVDFPRNEPVPTRATEWMRVVPGTGEVASRDSANQVGGASAPGGGNAEHVHGADGESISAGTESTTHFERVELEALNVEGFGMTEYEFERHETDSGWLIDPTDPATVYRTVSMSWQEVGLGSWSWETGPSESSWEAGPFRYPTEVVVPTAERFEQAARVYRSGEQVRVLYGPWQVVIRGIHAHSSRKVLARWEVHRTWFSVARSGERPVTDVPLARGATAPLGASERFALSASELRLRGASEVFYLGASERRLGGASETRFLAASQWIARGASERRLTGASEWRLAGASERRLMGSSERRLSGASERRLMGSSERRFAGASERRLGGASEPRLSGPFQLIKSKED